MKLGKVKTAAADSGIGSYFKLRTIKIKPEEILLDPRNPRLAIESEEFDGLSDGDIAKGQIQRAVMLQIEKNEHHVKDLVENIGDRPSSSLFVLNLSKVVLLLRFIPLVSIKV